MPEAKTIVRNTGFLFISETVVRIMSFFLIVLMARFLGDAEMGKYFFAVSYVSIFQVLADFGITTLMFRQIAADKKDTAKYFNNVLALKFVLLCAVILISLAIFPFIYPDSAAILPIVILTSIYFFLIGMISPFNILFNAYEKLENYAFVTVVQSVIAAVFGAFLLIRGFGLEVVLYCLIGSYCVSLIIAMILARRNFIRFAPSFDFKFWLMLIKKSFPFWMTGIFMIVFSSVDTLMLKFFKEYSIIGLYSVSLKLVESLNFIPFVLIGAVFPAMAFLHSNSSTLLDKLYNKTFYYMLVIALPIAFGTSILAERIIFSFYGGEYIGSALALQMLIWSSVFLFVNFLIGYLLNAIDKAKLFTVAVGISLGVNIILNYILIPMFASYEGAALSLVISQIVCFIILYFFALKEGYEANILLASKPLIASVIMAAVLYFLSFINLLILVPLGAAVYLTILFFLKGVGKEEINLVKGFFMK